ncbi:MAG: glycoside-pentoside-hexuronide (GPH):cation symporter [Clostridiaceae bacterium]|jgi:sugar (glycoside-pentoside-hexuronide) transporter|nr:glycoside-pentoside-hexuronide (GPH):cation symporter [Clostridiaceae bacterium]
MEDTTVQETKGTGALHKMFGTRPGEGMQPKEAISYSIAGLGQNLISGLVGSFVAYYFTNGLLIPSIAVGFIMLGVRLFDALNDPIMGSIVDKTKTKDGKCRPYLKWMPIPIAVLTVLLFMPVNLSVVWTGVIMTGVYLVWSVVYTIVDVPYWGLATAMTSETHQRGTVLTVARLFCTVGAGAISILIPSISGFWLKGSVDEATGLILEGYEQGAALALRSNFWWLALIIAAISIPTFFIGYKNTKERFYKNEDVRPLRENLTLLFKNKPLMTIVVSGILGGAKTLCLYSAIFVAQYNLAAAGVVFFGMKGTALATVITLAVVPGGLIASLLVPWCTKKFGKKNTFIWSHIIGGLAMLAMGLCGVNGNWTKSWVLIVNLIGLVIAGVPQGFSNILSYAMIADSVDYLEWKEGKRAEGICFAMQTFINKIGMAVGAAVSCFALAWASIDPKNNATFSLEGNPGGLNLLFLITILVPAISMILAAIPFFFYKFNEKEQALAIAETLARKGIDAYGNALDGAVTADAGRGYGDYAADANGAFENGNYSADGDGSEVAFRNPDPDDTEDI